MMNIMVTMMNRMMNRTMNIVMNRSDEQNDEHSVEHDAHNDEHKLALDYKELTQQALETKRKSPALAGIMSAVIPGTGRFYSKDWKDGIVSMFFAGAMGFQAYRGFSKSSIKSTRGWIYGGIGFGFYLGNIYGSVQSAKFYNKKSRQGIKNSIDKLFNSYY